MKRTKYTFVSLFITLIALFAIGGLGHSQEVEKGYQTWARVSPCVDHRSEWIIMASKDPNPHGLSHFLPAQIMLFDPAFNICNKQHPFGCTYDEAKAEALNIQTSPKFSLYACKDWNVWKNIDTGQFSLVKGSGNPGRSIHQRGGMTCEEAQAEAGLTGACGGTGPGGKCDPAVFAVIPGTWQSEFGPVTLGGSCDRITGSWKQSESMTGQIKGGHFNSSTRNAALPIFPGLEQSRGRGEVYTFNGWQNLEWNLESKRWHQWKLEPSQKLAQ